jgi:drug/metabolite transporter (DMT)-like permease
MRSATVACLLSALLFGASTPLAKLLLHDVQPLTLAGLLYLGAALGAAPFAARGGSAVLRRDPRQRVRLAAAVALGGVLAPVLLLLGLAAAPAASVALWLNAEVIATSLLAAAFFREHVDGRVWLAAALVLAGGVLLALPDGPASGRAALFVLMACVGWALDNNLTAVIDGFTPAQVTLTKGLIAGAFNLGLGLALGQRLPSPAILGAALALGAVSYGISIVLYITGAQQLGASRSQLLFATAPLFGVAIAWALLREPARGAQFAAALAMGAGIWLLLRGRHEHEHGHDPMTHTHRHRHDDGHHGHDGRPGHEAAPGGWHTHAHTHAAHRHAHAHVSDLHHRHEHGA